MILRTVKNIFLTGLLLLTLTSLAHAQACEVIIDGNCRLDVDILNFVGLSSAPATSDVGSGVMYFDPVTGKLQCSEDGGAYGDCVGAGGSSIVWDTVANLPGTPSTNDMAGVTDGADEEDCTVGTGSDQNLCVYSGAAWVIIGDGTAAPASGDSVTVNGVATDTTANFKDTAHIEYTLVDGGGGGPDDVEPTIVADSTNDYITQ